MENTINFKCKNCNKNLIKNQRKFCSKKCRRNYYKFHMEEYPSLLRNKEEMRIKNRELMAFKRTGLDYKTYKEMTKKCSICDWTFNIELHHKHPKKEGGKNNVDNLIALCPNHHRLLYTQKQLP